MESNEAIAVRFGRRLAIEVEVGYRAARPCGQWGVRARGSCPRKVVVPRCFEPYVASARSGLMSQKVISIHCLRRGCFTCFTSLCPLRRLYQADFGELDVRQVLVRHARHYRALGRARECAPVNTTTHWTLIRLSMIGDICVEFVTSFRHAFVPSFGALLSPFGFVASAEGCSKAEVFTIIVDWFQAN